MNLQKNYILLFIAFIIFIGLSAFLSISIFPKADLGIENLWDGISLLLVNVSAYLLFMLVFGFIKKSTLSFFYFKLIWIQEIFIILGFLGFGIGLVLMYAGMHEPPPPGVDPTAQLVSSLAIALITIIYGFCGATGFYLIQKYYEFKCYKDEAIKIVAPKEGFQFQSLIYFTIFVSILLFAIYIGSLGAGVELINIFTFEALIFVICINIIFIFLYDGNYLNLYKNIFWYNSESVSAIRYDLKFIRNMKKILSMVICLILIITPLVVLAALGLPNNIDVILLVIQNILIYYVIITLLILITNIIEAKEVGKLYLLIGEISLGNRFFVITYILPPAILLYIILLLTIYWTNI